MPVPDDIAARLDRTAVLAHHLSPSARRRAATMADQVRAATRTAAPSVRSEIDAELADIRQVLEAGAQSFRQRRRDHLRQGLGTLAFAALSVLLLDVFWARELRLPDIPVVVSTPGAPERTAFIITAVAPGSTGPEAGADIGSDPGLTDDGVALDAPGAASPTPSSGDPDRLGRSMVADGAESPPPPPPPDDDDEFAPPPGTGADLSPAVATPEPRPRPGRSVMRRLVGDVVPKTDPPPPEPPDAALPVADAAGDLGRDAAPMVDRPQGGGAAPGPRPLSLAAALRRAGRPDLQVGIGPRVLALHEDAPMDFMAVGPAAVPPEQRARVFGLHVSRTEVTQKQWAAVRHMDLSSISGQWDNPAEAMSWCEALRFANALSSKEHLHPVYTIDRDCEYGGTVYWDTRADGFRLLTETEWLALAATMPGTEPGGWDATTERVNNRGLYKVDVGVTSAPLKVTGLADNAREWVWGVDRRPDSQEGRTQVHTGAWPRSVVRGCDAVDPRADPDLDRKRQAIDQATNARCRMDPPPAAVPLGVGLRLARGPLEQS